MTKPESSRTLREVPRRATRPAVRPGTRPGYPPGMHRYVVTLKDEPADDQASDREQLVRAREKRTGRFRRMLLRLIREEGLQPEVAEIAAPTAFNMLSIVATKDMASRVGELDEVESVYRDRGLLRLVR